VAVSLGQLDEQHAEILQGLNADDMVVVSAQFLLDSESSRSSDFMRMHRADSGESEASEHGHQQHSGADHD